MPRRPVLLIYLAGIICLSSCAGAYHSSKYNFEDGIYYTKILSKDKVYITSPNEDTTVAYPATYINDSLVLDRNKKTIYSTTLKKYKGDKYYHTFYKPSFDIDIQTIAFKYRPYNNGFPNQLLSTYNGVLYFGYRADKYRLDYTRTPLNVYKRDVKHMGYSVGMFSGFGNTPMNEWVTNNKINIEYEGLLLISGVSVMTGVHSISFGIAAGVDHLLDKNKVFWIYQGKPWVGLTIGLNIN
ncbi:MAG: hypothetical protein WCG87_00160 [Bacteroidota bacterium]